jgi:hypothetical protein
MKPGTTSAVCALLAAASLAVTLMGPTACSDHHAGSSGSTSGSTGHTSPFPSCNEITQSCHSVDVGDGPIHDCHDTAHAATGDGDCASVKDSCLKLCADAKIDAGGGAVDAGGG